MMATLAPILAPIRLARHASRLPPIHGRHALAPRGAALGGADQGRERPVSDHSHARAFVLLLSHHSLQAANPRPAFQLMLPDPHDVEAFSSELPADAIVSPPV